MHAPNVVLHVLNHLDHGGAQDNTLASCEGLDRDRWRVVVAAPGGGAQAARAARVADAVVDLSHLRRDVAPAHEGPAYQELRHVIARLRPAVVHTHGSKAGVLGRLAAAAESVPAIVHTLHGMPVTPATPVWLRPVLLTAERRAARRAHEVVCVCDRNLAEARELRIVPPGQGVVVASGVDEELFASARTAARRADVRHRLGLPPDAVVGIWVGRLMEQKAPLDLIEAARQALAGNTDLHLLVVGDGELRPEVELAAAGLARLHLLGYRDDVADLLAAADVFVQSSLWEGLGRALTEACLVGLPSVATAVNGIPDLVSPGRTGLLVPAARPDRLAGALLEAVSDLARLRSWGEAAASAVRGRFDTSAMVAGLDAVYQRCLGHDTAHGRAVAGTP
jgi:glycosyltransferase involved in cell wall biosynthesis